MNNKTIVLNHLRTHGSITPLEAVTQYGIMRLGARVYDLRDDGIPIKTTMETSLNRYGIPVRYARYSLEEKKHGDQQVPGVQGGEAASKAIAV